MIKKFTKFVRKQLLRVEWIRREVEAYKLRRNEQSYHEWWAKLLQSGLAARDHETSVIVTDDGLIIDYIDGRKIGQKYVSPVFIDSTNWGGDKFGS